MNITKKDIDNLHAELTVEIKKEDYTTKVEELLSNYRKNANIPGFRKGHVPLGMIKKQYGKAVLIDEVNKLLQENLQKYLTEEKIEVLGNPLPKNESDIDWDTENFTFAFDLALAPKFEVDLKNKAITHYKIVADKKVIDDQIKSIRKQYGKLISKTKAEKGDEITATFTNTEKGIEQKSTFSLETVKGKKQQNTLLTAKIGDEIKLNTKGLFKEEQDLQRYLGVTPEDSKDLDIEVSLKVEEINTREMAELNQELYDKLFGKDEVKSEKELENKIKEGYEKQFEQQSDQKLLNDVIETLIENTKFDLPSDLLQKWIQVSGKEPLTEEQAKEEYKKSEKGLRYQLIEAKLRSDNNLQVTFEELKDYATNLIKAQMAQYGQNNPTQEELDGVVARIMSNQEEIQRLNEQLSTNKLLQFFKENAKLKTKETNFEKFMKEAYA